MISKPTLSWERVGHNVDEGPAALVTEGGILVPVPLTLCVPCNTCLANTFLFIHLLSAHTLKKRSSSHSLPALQAPCTVLDFWRHQLTVISLIPIATLGCSNFGGRRMVGRFSVLPSRTALLCSWPNPTPPAPPFRPEGSSPLARHLRMKMQLLLDRTLSFLC